MIIRQAASSRALISAVVTAALFAAAACSKINSDTVTIDDACEISFSSEKPGFEDDTKTAWTGETICWSKNDYIRVAYTRDGVWQNAAGTATATSKNAKIYASDRLSEDSKTARFNLHKNFVDNNSGEFVFYAIYPGTINNKSSDFKNAPSLTVTIPVLQTPQADSFDSSADFMIGNSAEAYESLPIGQTVSMTWDRIVAHAQLTFKTLNGFKSGETLQKVTLTADSAADMVGQHNVTLDTKTISKVSGQTSNVLDFDCSNISIDENGNFTLWAVFLPCHIGSLDIVVTTNKATYSRSIASCNLDFAKNARNILSINMSSATRTSDSESGDGSGDTEGGDNSEDGNGDNTGSGEEGSSKVLRTYLMNYEIPANDVEVLGESDVLYGGNYCHKTFDETHGSTKACRYDTSDENRKIVTHTFLYNSKVIRNYTILFDKNYKVALWAAFACCNSGDYADNNVGRSSSAWAYDPALDTSWQPNLTSSYKTSESGNSYDRGHQVASNDRQTTADQNKQTFYYSNMTPQFGSLNQGKWGILENKVQELADNTTGRDTLYVVTGPLFEGTCDTATDVSGSNFIVPTGYWKCIMKCSFDTSGAMTSATGCAYLFESNSANVSPSVTTIDAIEERTGFDLYTNVPSAIQEAAESTATAFFSVN